MCRSTLQVADLRWYTFVSETLLAIQLIKTAKYTDEIPHNLKWMTLLVLRDLIERVERLEETCANSGPEPTQNKE